MNLLILVDFCHLSVLVDFGVPTRVPTWGVPEWPIPRGVPNGLFIKVSGGGPREGVPGGRPDRRPDLGVGGRILLSFRRGCLGWSDSGPGRGL